MWAAFEQKHDRRGGRRHVLRPAAERQMTLIRRMRSVDVFMDGHGVGDLSDRKMERQRLLQHHAVYARLFMKAAQPSTNLRRAGIAGETIDYHLDADTLAHPFEITNVCKA